MKKVLTSLGVVMVMLGGAVSVIGAVDVYAADDICDEDSGVSAELKAVAGCNEITAGSNKTAVPIALNIINVVLSLVGLLAVGVIVYGGILYVTSTGDSSKISKAKNCILYGVVGLVVAIMAFAIVAFVNASVLKKS